MFSGCFFTFRQPEINIRYCEVAKANCGNLLNAIKPFSLDHPKHLGDCHAYGSQ
ncbi:MAG: hypothetical protein IJR46_04620 [Neisseriaceae bacterium]|nr:hypothetical protein [Neisseriaceae bacterium]